MAMAESKIYGFEEVSKHNSNKDCWLIVEGKVYDVTPLLDDHPGGDQVLISATGKDATDDFEGLGHRYDAREKMHKYLVGNVDVSTIPVKQTCVPPQQAP